MLAEKKVIVYILLFIFLISLGMSLFINLSALQKNFLFADEATYFMMTQSLSQDGDLEYSKADLIRYYKDFGITPQGLFLKRGKNQQIFYAKSFAYPVFAAPFYKILGLNGLLVFHSLLLLLLLFMGFQYLTLINRPLLSLLALLTFFFASVAMVYYFWLSPDFFNLTLVFSVLFLWLYKYTFHQVSDQEAKKSRLTTFFLSDWSDYLACLLAGIAVYSKPPNIALMGPLVLYFLLKKKFLKTGLMIVIFLISTGIFWGINQGITGDWNYQGGERKTFYGQGGYPFEKAHLDFDTAVGWSMSSEGYAEKHLYPPKVFIHNIFYYFFGRFTGMVWYFFPAFLALILFFIRKKHLCQWLILAALAGEILIYIILMPDNYAGGGGALANRYFLNIYPFFFFLPALKKDLKEIGVTWIMASIFVVPILISPVQHSHYPDTHVKKFPFTMLPVELTLFNNFPTTTNPAASRQGVGMKYTWINFLDGNFHPRTSSELEKNGFWTRGPHKAQMVMRTYYPIKQITFHLMNNPRLKNEITVWFAGEKKTITLGRKQRGDITFTPKKVFQMNPWIHLYKLAVKASKGSIPNFEEEKEDERRYLGVWFEVTIIPEYMPE